MTQPGLLPEPKHSKPRITRIRADKNERGQLYISAYPRHPRFLFVFSEMNCQRGKIEAGGSATPDSKSKNRTSHAQSDSNCLQYRCRPGPGERHVAGGGLKMGQVIGESSAKAEVPKSVPIHPKELMATIFHVLGIDPQTQFIDQSGRPQFLLPDSAKPIKELV